MTQKHTNTPKQSRPSHPFRPGHEGKPGTPRGKLRDLTSCPECGASYRDGRWTAKKAPAGSPEELCPACERIRDDYPAAVLSVEGGFVAAHRDEIEGLLRNVEEQERGQHPLKRIMKIEPAESGFVVSTTDVKLAEHFGRALRDAYEGELELPPTSRDPENLARVRWARDD